ncbi:MAG TPA: LacI family DNA-binding transcriptional regulator [Blastocatellia bacterium]|nr:LacI family DNA-binding transcriptional regulator [Blastocatellia bacterium]
MPRRVGTRKNNGGNSHTNHRPVSLKELAAHLDLSPTTLSLVLNDAPAASAIPQQTKDRIFEAARGFNYRPNFIARSLRAQRSYTLGVLVPELSDGYSAMVLSGVEDYLIQEGYFYIVASHRHKPKLLDRYPDLLLERSIEGLIAVDTPQRRRPSLPVVSVSGHDDVEGVTNIALNHERAALLALRHLLDLGHRRIAVIKGQHFSSDTEVRWNSIRDAAIELGIRIDRALVAQLEGDSPSPEVGYIAAKKLLAAGKPFTALFAFNDISAIGAIRAFREAGLRVPEDVSVIGFDDVHAAAFHNPALTTIRQPLWQMGKLAAETLLQRIAAGPAAAYPRVLQVEPELVIRQSTASARTAAQSGKRVRLRA